MELAIRANREWEMILSTSTKQVRDAAESKFKKKEAQAREGSQATAEYEAAARAVQEKTARLKALRLARDSEKTG